MKVFGNLFSFESAFAYNSNAIAFSNCLLLKEINPDIRIGKNIQEIIVNYTTSKIKMNIQGVIHCVPFDINVDSNALTVVERDVDDSDFDHASDDE
jgi:hypothetical protein